MYYCSSFSVKMDTIVEYAPKNKTKSKVWEYIKVVFISITLFMGAATAIMSFHSDAEMPQILRGYYTTFYKRRQSFNIGNSILFRTWNWNYFIL